MKKHFPALDISLGTLEGGGPRDCPEDSTPASGAGNRWLDALAAPRIAAPCLVAFGILLLIVNLGAYPIYTKGEPREAIRVLDIIRGGGWILPSQAGLEPPWKPPLMYWLGALVSMLLGSVNEWTVRLPSGLLAVGGIVYCYVSVRRLFDDRSALMAALVLATTFQYGQAATAARVDMTLTFCLEVAFFEFIAIAEGLTHRRMLLYAALAAGTLAKGPIAVALPGLVALIWITVERRWCLLRELRIVRGASLVAVGAGGWYAAAMIIGGQAFIHRQILSENLYRLFPSHAFHEPHQHPFYFVELALLAGFMPWTVLMPLASAALTRRMRIWNPRFSYLVIWTATVLIFYNLPRSKRGVYLLAIYPALAAIIVILLNAVRQRTGDLARRLELTAWAAGAAFIGVGVATLAAELGMWLYGPDVLAPVMRLAGVHAHGLTVHLANAIAAFPVMSVALPLIGCATGTYLVLARLDVDRLFAAVVTGISAATLAAHLFVVPAIAQTLTLKYFTLDSMKIAGTHRLAELGDINFDVVFYGGKNILMGAPGQAHEAEYFLCWRRYYRLLPEAARRKFLIIRTSHPTSMNGNRRMLLLKRADLPIYPDVSLRNWHHVGAAKLRRLCSGHC